MASSTGPGGVISDATSADIQAVNPVVSVNGAVIPYCYGQRVWKTSGVQPAKATIWLSGNGLDVTGPVTLNKHSFGIKRFDPVVITDGSNTIFSGIVLERLDQGDNNTVMWGAHDWRILLQWIPVTGCMIWDEVAGAVVYSRRHPTQFNPGGRWNCIIKNDIPVFTHLATEQIESGNASDVLYSETDKADTVCPWTPARALKYLAYVANLSIGNFGGADIKTWRSLASSTHLKFPVEATKISSVSQSYYSVLQDTSIEAMSMAGAIDNIVRQAGVIDVKASYSGETANLQFFALKLSDEQRTQAGAASIPLVRGGTATDANTAYDFDLRESGVKQVGAVAVVGAPVRIETKLSYDPDDPASATLEDASSESERWAWQKIVYGVVVGGDNYAYRPASIPADGNWGSNSGSSITWEIMDGTNGRQKVLARSAAAVKLARTFLRKPWRSLRIKVSQLISSKVHEGVSNAFAGQPFLQTPRTILLEQLQRIVSRYTGQKMLKAKMPIRIEIDGHQVMANDGLTVDDDGTLLFAGLTEESGAGSDCIYTNSLRNPEALSLKKISINVAFPLDFRTVGYASKSLSSVDGEIGGPPVLMIDAGDSYPVEHQVGSEPLPTSDIPKVSGEGADPIPLTRILRNEQTQADQAAERMLSDRGEPEITSQWSMIGIRTDFDVGSWIEKIYCIGSGENDYAINAPLKSILYDFENQTTVFGGLLHSTVTPRKPAKTAKSTVYDPSNASSYEGFVDE